MSPYSAFLLLISPLAIIADSFAKALVSNGFHELLTWVVFIGLGIYLFGMKKQVTIMATGDISNSVEHKYTYLGPLEISLIAAPGIFWLLYPLTANILLIIVSTVVIYLVVTTVKASSISMVENG